MLIGRIVLVSSVALLAMSPDAGAEEHDQHSSMPRQAAVHAQLKASLWTPYRGVTAIGPAAKLDLDTDMPATEELVVYGQRRHSREDFEKGPEPLTFGPATLSGSTVTDLPSFRGLKVTAAVPIPGVSGLSAVANLSAGHDQVNTSTTAASAAATVGVKLDF